jgi:hypothetical protein
MRARLWGAAVALAAGAASCGPAGPPPAIPREMAERVPPGALLVAGARLDALRASPLDAHLPPAARTFLEPLKDASDVLAAFDGEGILLIARGHFREAAAGATLVGSNLMLSGSSALVQAALAGRRAGSPGPRDLLAHASTAAAGHAVWVATRGNVNLPLTGDAANLNRFLRMADFATVGLRIEPPMQLDVAAQCGSPDNAQHVEETLRAFLSLSAAGLARQPELAAMLRSAGVQREGTTVRASLTAPADAVPRLFDLFDR